MADAAAALYTRGIDVTVLFIGSPAPLSDRLDRERVPWVSLGLRRGALVLRHPVRIVKAMRELGCDGAVVNATGYLPWLIRIAGYGPPMLAVEHGDALNLHTAALSRRLRVRAERWLCARSRYLEVAVSDTMLAASRRVTGRAGRRIYNGVDLQRFKPGERSSTVSEEVIVGVASRLAAGKGIDVLIGACRLVKTDRRWRLRIAGDGPEAAFLQTLVDRDPALRARVVFEGTVSDMPHFWNACDVAVVPSSQWIESFSMAAVEAMACALPLVASASGALPEICGECATLVAPGSEEALAQALRRYINDPKLRRAHARVGRERAEALFDIEGMVDAYLEALRGGASRRERAALSPLSDLAGKRAAPSVTSWGR
jgi:glycosyltransferase involved in cell wall biosynthesis